MDIKHFELKHRGPHQATSYSSMASRPSCSSLGMLLRPALHPTNSSKRLSLTSSSVSRPRLPTPPRHIPSFTPVRHATHGAQGRANGPKNGPGKRLGAKKTGDQYVIPGNIIFRQRGAVWHPGANVGMGRDHTIFAKEAGFVKFYRDPRLHKKRQYIGVVFDKNETLPYPPHAARRRRLNMLAVPRKELDIDILPSEMDDAGIEVSTTVSSTGTLDVIRPKPESPEDRRRRLQGRIPLNELKMGDDYSFRETNWQIGRAPERAGIIAPRYKPGDRFAAWRRRNVRKAKAAEKRALGGKSKGGKGKGKGRKK